MKFSVKLAMLVVGLVLGGIVTSVPVEAKNVVVGNHELGSFVKNDPLNRPLTRSKRSLNDLPPRIDFIDVSSNNGEISVEQYKKMKAAGVKGVVVKLTEGSVYRNPLAPSQVANAKAAGLVVSTYHFSWFENQQEAIDQANYYADYAEELGLSKNSVMVNDAEASPLINADATKVSVYFRDQLEKRGFKNIVHYSSASWFNNNWMEYGVLGKENCWVAEWPASPSGNHLLHTDTAAWQWGNKGSFNFIPTSTFDCNVDYLGRFTTTNQKKMLATGLENHTPYVYLNVSSDEFQSPKRLMVYVDGQYYFETYQGKSYYSYRASLPDGTEQIRRKFAGKAGQKIEVFEAPGIPGTNSDGKQLLESITLDKDLIA